MPQNGSSHDASSAYVGSGNHDPYNLYSMDKVDKITETPICLLCTSEIYFTLYSSMLYMLHTSNISDSLPSILSFSGLRNIYYLSSYGTIHSLSDALPSPGREFLLLERL